MSAAMQDWDDQHGRKAVAAPAPVAGKVDVLTVMDDAAAAGPSIHCTNQRTGEIHSHELREASAAVAELIAADKEYDRAKHAWLDCAPDGLGEIDTRSEDHPLWTALQAATERRAAALARVQP